MDKKKALLKKILDQYWENHDFNGLRDITFLDQPVEIIEDLVKQGDIVLKFEDEFCNPSIKAFEEKATAEDQISKLQRNVSCCAYPSKKYLAEQTLPSNWDDLPYSKEMARGEHAFSWRSFELKYFNHFKSDPSFEFQDNFYQGTICNNLFYLRYGLSFYLKSKERCWGAFLRDLSKLPKNEQKQFKAHEIEDETTPHPLYYNHAMGRWSEHDSVFNATLHELGNIDSMTKNITKGTSLFKINYNDLRENVPPGYHYLTQQTSKCFSDFSLALAQIIIDNLNKDYFSIAGVNLKNKDGSVRGTIRLLEIFLNEKCKITTPGGSKLLLDEFRFIQRVRSKYAHGSGRNIADPSLESEQKELITKAYSALFSLRTLLKCHPESGSIDENDLELFF